MEGIRSAHQKTGLAPSSVIVDSAPFVAAKVSSPLGYDAETDRLLVNPGWPHWGSLAARTAELAGAGVWSTRTDDHIYVHEMAHKSLALKLGIDTYRSFRRERWQDAADVEVAKQVSAQAAKSPSEFVAEVYAMLRNGLRVPVQVRVLYARLEGP